MPPPGQRGMHHGQVLWEFSLYLIVLAMMPQCPNRMVRLAIFGPLGATTTTDMHRKAVKLALQRPQWMCMWLS